MISTKYTLPNPSEEQREIILGFGQGYNLKIEAIAGSGKTTTLLLLALEAKLKFGSKSVIITYNRELKDEITGKISDIGLSNYCQGYTYHGYASKLYGRTINNDKLLREALNSSQSIISDYNVILLDEVQDMNEDYHNFITKILSHGKLLVLVGDRRQCINDYIGANSKYLVNYSDYFATGRPWKELLLRTSYRLTEATAAFVNQCILCDNTNIIGGNRVSQNYQPIYQHGIWGLQGLVSMAVNRYGPDEVVIVLASVRNLNPMSPVGRLCTKRQDGIMFCVKDGEIANEIMQGKVLITSYNSMKGRERKCVIVIGFDESYFEYYDKTWSITEPTLPNIIYVIGTRAREQLILVQDSKKSRFRTITTSSLFSTCEVKGDIEEKDPDKKSGATKSHYYVTDLIRHRNTTDIIDLCNLIQIESLNPFGEPLPYKNIVQFGGYYEDMKSYYGTLIPLLTNYKKNGKIEIPLFDIDKLSKKSKEMDFNIIERCNQLIVKEEKEITEWMELVVLMSAICNNYYFYAYQIINYDWVDINFINQQVDRLLSKLQDTSGIFEYSVEVKESGWTLEGSYDYFLENELWEFKCATNLSDEHKIQCGTYIAMHYHNTQELIPCKLYNTRTEELVQITVSDPKKYLEVFVRAMK